jgi:hypothetical protein
MDDIKKKGLTRTQKRKFLAAEYEIEVFSSFNTCKMETMLEKQENKMKKIVCALSHFVI